MKKLLILLAGGIAAIVALSLTGPLLGFAFSALLVFAGMHYYVKSKSTISKIFYVVLGLIGVFSAISNIPALIGLGALAVIYVLYKKWNNEEVSFSNVTIKEDDPFTNFENEWAKLTK
ncbi:ABC transporter permease [Lysinibacillus endophyticus]|uniref:ABC transporter permease n=1 Tax=Ureibacillus endophyticus TaxID=1978490 RepID=A0A494Z6A3_9BACL|nr:ABC transporter permease [Lysinibacillus endophyticus]MCP1144201.1 ABC transporter permease [Lysinibacillus endophyticus]RKQ18015.1 ABC transporter permease [Lysinibacillus endophyticus]